MAGTPIGLIATLAGRTVTEVGRQPYLIYGRLRTADAVSPIAGGAVVGSLAVAVALYKLVLLSFFWYAGPLVLRRPKQPEPVAPVGRPIGAIGLSKPNVLAAEIILASLVFSYCAFGGTVSTEKPDL